MFANYFDSKVQRIRASFPTTTADPMNAEQLYYGPELCEFSPTMANAGNVRSRDPLCRLREKNTRCLISLLVEKLARVFKANH